MVVLIIMNDFFYDAIFGVRATTRPGLRVAVTKGEPGCCSVTRGGGV